VPVRIKWATRCASVFVFPVPAPAMMRSGPEMGAPAIFETPYSTAARWAPFKSRRYVGRSRARCCRGSKNRPVSEARSAETRARFREHYPWRRTRLAAQSSRRTVSMTSMTVLRSWELCIEEIPQRPSLGQNHARKNGPVPQTAQHCFVHVLFLYAGFRGSAMTIGFYTSRSLLPLKPTDCAVVREHQCKTVIGSRFRALSAKNRSLLLMCARTLRGSSPAPVTGKDPPA
jgi:hypothetical protein